MPRVKLERLVESKPSTSRKHTSNAEEQPIGSDLAPAIVTFNHPVTNQLSIRKKLAGTPFLVDVDTGLVYLEPTLLKALKNN